MNLPNVRRHAPSMGRWPVWLLPALLVSWVLHTATYTQFTRTRIIVSSAARAPVGETVSLSLPQTAALTPKPTVLIVRLQNRSSAPVQLRVTVRGLEVARPVVTPLRTRRLDLGLPDSAARDLDGPLEITGSGDWVLEYAEVANLYGYSNGAASFVVLPVGSDEYAHPSPARRWLVTCVLLVLGTIQRSGQRRAGRRIHLALVVIVATFLGLTLLAPLAAGYAIVLSFQTILLCAALVHYPGVMQAYRGTLRLLTRDYRAEAAPAGAQRDPSWLPAGSATFRRFRLAAGVLVALASVLFIAARIRSTAHFVDESDLALLGLYTRQALHGDLLVGPYSRFNWHHPGPMYFFVLAPLYWLTDHHQQSLAWTAALVNLGSVWLLLSRLNTRGGFGVFVAGAALVLVYLLQAEWLLASPWNPHVTALPLAALIVLCADFASAVGLGMLPLIVLLASFLAQTHVGYVPCAGGLVLTSLGLHLRFRRHRDAPLARGRASDLRYLLASAGVLCVVWAPPVIENLRHDPGNLTMVYRFFLASSGTLHVLDAVGAYTHYMAALPMWRLGTGGGGGPAPGFEWLACWLTLAQLAILWPVSRWARLRDRHFHRALCLVSLTGSVIALWSVSRIAGPIFDHLVFWVSVLSVTNLTAILAVVTCQGWDYLQMRRLVPADWHTRALPSLLPALLVVTLASYHLPRLAGEQRRSGAGSLRVKTAVDGLQSYLDQHGIQRPTLHISPDAWPFAAGVVLELSEAGRAVAVEPRWVFMFTDAFAENGSEDAQFNVVDAQRDGLKWLLEFEPVAGGDDASIYRRFQLGASRRLAPSSRILGTNRTRRNPAQIVDGRVLADGSGWEDEGTLLFDGVGSFVTLTVPATATGVALSADGNDTWRLECSSNGSPFELVGIVPAQRGYGIRTREAHFRGLTSCQQLRLSPGTGDGLFSISEVTFLSASRER